MKLLRNNNNSKSNIDEKKHNIISLTRVAGKGENADHIWIGGTRMVLVVDGNVMLGQNTAADAAEQHDVEELLELRDGRPWIDLFRGFGQKRKHGVGEQACNKTVLS